MVHKLLCSSCSDDDDDDRSSRSLTLSCSTSLVRTPKRFDALPSPLCSGKLCRYTLLALSLISYAMHASTSTLLCFSDSMALRIPPMPLKNSIMRMEIFFFSLDVVDDDSTTRLLTAMVRFKDTVDGTARFILRFTSNLPFQFPPSSRDNEVCRPRKMLEQKEVLSVGVVAFRGQNGVLCFHRCCFLSPVNSRFNDKFHELAASLFGIQFSNTYKGRLIKEDSLSIPP